MCACIQTVHTSFGCGYEHTAETSKTPSEWSPSAAVVSSVWWPCDLFVQPQWPFLLAEEGRERDRGRASRREGGRADRFTPSPLLAPPMSHLILLLTAKSTPLTHSSLVGPTTAGCCSACPASSDFSRRQWAQANLFVWISILEDSYGYVSLENKTCGPSSLTMSHGQPPSHSLHPVLKIRALISCRFQRNDGKEEWQRSKEWEKKTKQAEFVNKTYR